ncbi:MAG: LysR family transcriptional regulator [Devosia sp.]
MSISNEKILDLKPLEVFLAVMSCGSITGAARMVGCSQPAATRHVRDLEAAVGFQLFHRNGPRISATERGMRFHEEASRIVSGMQQIRSRANAIRDGLEPSLDIAATPTMAGGLVGAALARINADLPYIIDTQTQNAEHVVRSLIMRTAHVGLSAFPLDYAGLDMHVVCESECVAVVAADGPFGAHDVLELEVLKSVRMATVANIYRLRNVIDEALAAAHVVPVAEYSTNSSLNAVMAARSGLGVSIVDPVTAYGIPVEGTRIVRLATRIPYVWGLFTTSGRIVTPVIAEFIDAFEAVCRDIVPGSAVHVARTAAGAKRISDLSRE